MKSNYATAAIKKKPLILNAVQANEVDKIVKSAHINSLIKNYNAEIKTGGVKFGNLPSGIQTAIASVSFQYGVNLRIATPDFWKAVVSQDWNMAKGILNDFGDRYPTRRRLEANLIVIKKR